jgi:hypothetical protein
MAYERETNSNENGGWLADRRCARREDEKSAVVDVFRDGEQPGCALRCAGDHLHRGRLAVAERAQEMAEGAVLRRRIGGGREALVVIGVMVNDQDRVVVAIVRRVPPAHGAGQGEQDR